ncbi:MAG: RdgB/HAM1 family non-canonical purine NTP pyrophosphatase [Candidatus Nanoarchaeia archaeon]|nr:RdgB/HAM1 family non-canonical purine NTP pyrophosphatase [Candidatus Nanoarchaeia archaeon]
MINITFVTTNKHKFEEVKHFLRDYPINLEHLERGYDENHDLTAEEISSNAAKKLAEELNKKVIVEDTGLYFEAFNNFPGIFPKFVMNSIGYKGILKLLKGENRNAYFRTVAAFCEPGKEPKIFDGTMKGRITTKVYDIDKDAMPYNRIFIPDNKKKPISSMTLEERNSFSQRAQAFKKFGDFIKNELK